MVIDRSETTSDCIRFQIYLPHAERVELMGDFTNWEAQPIEMKRGDGDGSGWWTAECDIPEGDHTFSYLVDGHYWMPDYAASGLHRNEYGRWTSNLTVEKRSDRLPPPRFGRVREKDARIARAPARAHRLST